MSDKSTPETDAFFRKDAQNYPAANFARKLERERDELRAEVAEIIHDEIGENSCEVVFIKSRFDELHGQIDDMRAEVERLKADREIVEWMGINRVEVLEAMGRVAK